MNEENKKEIRLTKEALKLRENLRKRKQQQRGRTEQKNKIISTLTASCLCKKVQIEVIDDFEYMGNCHCKECRKFTGSDYSSVGGLSSNKFNIKAGKEFISIYRKSEETSLAFCSCCGSSLYSIKHKTDKYNIRLGILDNTPTNKPSFHIFTDSKAPWHKITDNLTQFKKRN